MLLWLPGTLRQLYLLCDICNVFQTSSFLKLLQVFLQHINVLENYQDWLYFLPLMLSIGSMGGGGGVKPGIYSSFIS